MYENLVTNKLLRGNNLGLWLLAEMVSAFKNYLFIFLFIFLVYFSFLGRIKDKWENHLWSASGLFWKSDYGVHQQIWTRITCRMKRVCFVIWFHLRKEVSVCSHFKVWVVTLYGLLYSWKNSLWWGSVDTIAYKLRNRINHKCMFTTLAGARENWKKEKPSSHIFF